MITGAERLAIFQLLEIPLRKGIAVDEAFDNTNEVYSEDAINQIDDWLAHVSSDEETEIKAIILKFQNIKYNTVQVKTDKVTLDYGRERSQLQDQMKIILPINYNEFTDSSSMVVG